MTLSDVERLFSAITPDPAIRWLWLKCFNRGVELGVLDGEQEFFELLPLCLGSATAPVLAAYEANEPVGAHERASAVDRLRSWGETYNFNRSMTVIRAAQARGWRSCFTAERNPPEEVAVLARARVPAPYLASALELGLSLDDTLAAWLADVPIEYLAVGA